MIVCTGMAVAELEDGPAIVAGVTRVVAGVITFGESSLTSLAGLLDLSFSFSLDSSPLSFSLSFREWTEDLLDLQFDSFSDISDNGLPRL